MLYVDCGQPTSPTNGVVSFSSGTTPGAEVRFQCNPGFRLDGNAMNMCNLTGKWEPETPTCQLIGIKRFLHEAGIHFWIGNARSLISNKVYFKLLNISDFARYLYVNNV